MLHIFSNIMKISLTVQNFRTDTIFILNIPEESKKKKKKKKKTGGIMVFVLCILSDEALYLYQVSLKYQ